ncbi:MAG: plastocyanin/azurin family copper-binding protein [Nitrosopumilus sp.]|uniref:plastocyanin/azurin family copper-binding protein n=1 Tax=Nitrosopumilus sp. TaxID=2024843 RepID=UPI00246C6C57|nr:plastocyanin/azurin family copper-binding protein [Nitrosopumilus sp.]MDH5430934.1 plastocyanin/azurin family copper-binding protein [Nitrosopumilus sp.]
MSNWDLMMPGMGLTAIGLAGLTLSYAGIAHTFIDGMHALTGLTMFVGLIFLAAGILDGGVSTSNRAKATTLVILSIALGFGMYSMVLNTSNYTVTIAGILMAIAFPAIIISYLYMKHPTIAKPIGAIVSMAAATGIIMWVSFGIFSAPDTYMIPQQIGVEEPVEDLTPSGPIFTIEILAESVEEGNPDYDPDVAIVQQGHVIEWTNADTVAHTVTSASDFGETFDSSLINAGEVYTLDTNDLEIGEYEYLCIVHPWMVATLVIEAAKEPTKVIIPEGAAIPEDGQIYYDPEILDITAGTTVVWDNVDTTVHTVTSGIAPETDGIFDSGMMSAGDVFEFTFTDAGTYDYFCTFHPWMVGTVNVE